MCNCCIISGFGVFYGSPLAKNCSFRIIPLCMHFMYMSGAHTLLMCSLIQKTLLLYLLFTKQAMNRHIPSYIWIVCVYTAARFPRIIWSWLCMPNRGGNTHNNDAFSLSLSLTISVWMRFMQHTIFRLVWSPESILLVLVVRVSERERDAKCGKTKIYCRQFWFDW